MSENKLATVMFNLESCISTPEIIALLPSTVRTRVLEGLKIYKRGGELTAEAAEWFTRVHEAIRNDTKLVV